MQRLVALIMKGIEVITVLLLAVMSILVIVNVFMRFLLDSGIVFSEEVSRYIFIWVIFLGAIIAMYRNAHVNVAFIRDSLSPSLQLIIKVLCNIGMIYCCYLLGSGSFDLYEFNLIDLSPVAQIPLGYIYLAGTVGAIGMAIILALQTFELFTKKNTEKENA